MASSIFTNSHTSLSSTTALLLRRRHPINVGPSPTSLRFVALHSSSRSSRVSHIAASATESSAKVIDEKLVAKQVRDEITTSKVIDGITVAKKVKDEIKDEVSRMKEAIGVTPGLVVIRVGDEEESKTYVHYKKIACKYVGIEFFEKHLSKDSTEEEVLNYIKRYNDDPSVHGILVQLPLPSHMNVENILNAIRVEKDVDGFHPFNQESLANGGEPLFVPCTPKGCIELLHKSDVAIKGKKAVVIGRSMIVGTPARLLLEREGAAKVDVVHSKTTNPEEITRQADIIIVAVGKPNLVRGNWIKPGAVVIDVGITRVTDPSCKNGYKSVGDVCYEEAIKVASTITPVPGGVGPMTIAMLLQNTLIAAKRIHNFE